MINKSWKLNPNQNTEKEESLFNELIPYAKNKNPNTLSSFKILAKLLINRGINTVAEATEFNQLELKNLHDPFLMNSMNEAVLRIQKALDNNQKIMVYGDYDVDGTTSVALMVSFLQKLTSNLIYYIPDRYNEGYGVSFLSIDYAKKEGVSLIIALDCGIKAIDKVEHANKLGVDFIICDHHTPGNELPNAIAVLDPKRTDCQYPYKELSGCGIGFKLCQALQQKLNLNFDLNSLLDLTDISIDCDIVPVTGENRVLASLGLRLINKSPRKSILKLLDEKQENKPVQISDLVFQIGPKINAAGRISTGKTSVDLLLATDPEEIENFTAKIKEFNSTRKEEDKRITEEAIEMLQSDTNLAKKNSTVLYHPNWHKGVIGIVASRVIESFYKPTIILTNSKNDIIGGSVRSVKDFDVYQALEQCTEHMIQFGGHKFAAGLTLKKSQLPEFTTKFEEVVNAQMNSDCFVPEITYDAEIYLEEVTMMLKTNINKLEPFGPKNITPTFVTHHLIDSGNSRTVGADKTHLKLELSDPNSGVTLSGIAFGLGHLESTIKESKSISVAYTIDINHWRGKSTIQLMVKDIQFKDMK